MKSLVVAADFHPMAVLLTLISISLNVMIIKDAGSFIACRQGKFDVDQLLEDFRNHARIHQLYVVAPCSLMGQVLFTFIRTLQIRLLAVGR
jgi:hypothetical protein